MLEERTAQLNVRRSALEVCLHKLMDRYMEMSSQLVTVPDHFHARQTFQNDCNYHYQYFQVMLLYMDSAEASVNR
jgi:hypothetical protein